MTDEPNQKPERRVIFKNGKLYVNLIKRKTNPHGQKDMEAMRAKSVEQSKRKKRVHSLEGQFRKILGYYKTRGTIQNPMAPIYCEIRKCNNCPLREREYEIYAKGEIIKMKKKSACPGYKEGKENCILSLEDFLKSCMQFYNYLESDDFTRKTMKFLLGQTMQDAEANRQMEILKNGAPGRQTLEYRKLILEFLDKMRQSDEGVKINVDQKVTQEVDLEKLGLSKEEAYRIGDMLIEKTRMKIPNVEYKITEETKNDSDVHEVPTESSSSDRPEDTE